MPEKKWVFDAVVLSNFLLSEAIFILKKSSSKTGRSFTQRFAQSGQSLSEDILWINGQVESWKQLRLIVKKLELTIVDIFFLIVAGGLFRPGF